MSDLASFRPWHPDDVVLQMGHVPTCCCRYVCDPADTTDVKLIDVRCIGAVLTPVRDTRPMPAADDPTEYCEACCGYRSIDHVHRGPNLSGERY